MGAAYNPLNPVFYNKRGIRVSHWPTDILGQAAVFEEINPSITVWRAFPAYRTAGAQVEVRPLPGNTGSVFLKFDAVGLVGATTSGGNRITLNAGSSPIYLFIPSGDLASLCFLPAVANEGVVVSVGVRGGGSGTPPAAPGGGEAPPGDGGGGGAPPGNGGGGGGGGGVPR